MIEQFKPGQTVCHKEAPEVRLLVIGQSGDDLWLRDDNCNETAYRHDSRMFTATDPNQPAEPVPQKCPFCGSNSIVQDSDKPYVVCLGSCCAEGPMKLTCLEAVQAWNSIGILSVPAKTPDETLPGACPRCKSSDVLVNRRDVPNHFGTGLSRVWNVQCRGCYRSGSVKLTAGGAVNAWNESK